MAEFEFDLFVIGGGSGGVRAARIASGHGAKVGIAESYRYGGTCVIRGCVPKKLLVYASRFSHEFETAKGFGWQVGETQFSWPGLIAQKDKEIARLENIYKSNLEGAKVTTFQDHAKLKDAHTVELIRTGQTVRAERILIATGGQPNVDTLIEGHEHIITSNEAFHLETLPKSVVIAGGGYIAVEFAGIFAGMGVETTLIYRRDKILRGFDEDMRDAVEAAYRARGIRFVYNRVFSKIEQASGGGLVGHLDNGATLEAEQIMFAIGRTPATDNLGLEAAGVETGPGGAIKVDAKSATNIPNIYAVGDVTDRVQLTPVAIREGHAFADTMYGDKDWSADYEMIPTAVFSTPEIGTVGLSEHEARAKFANVDLYKSSFRTMKAAFSGGEDRVLMKLIVDRDTDRILGCHIAGDDAAEIVQVVAISMRMGVTKSNFDSTMALHPSISEELVTMRQKWTPPAQAAE